VREELCPYDDKKDDINPHEHSLKIWKIGSWPGVWKINKIDTKERYIKEYAHRIDVEWQFNKAPFVADFSTWQDTVHQVFEDDLDKYHFGVSSSREIHCMTCFTMAQHSVLSQNVICP